MADITSVLFYLESGRTEKTMGVVSLDPLLRHNGWSLATMILQYNDAADDKRVLQDTPEAIMSGFPLTHPPRKRALRRSRRGCRRGYQRRKPKSPPPPRLERSWRTTRTAG